MSLRKNENFRDDGVITFEDGNSIIFDWEKRDAHWTGDRFPFSELGQFERKLQKQEIKLSIQCNKEEKTFAIGWHEDWLKENKIRRNLATNNVDESGVVRYTSKFKVYSYDEIDKFMDVIIKAFKKSAFNYRSFEKPRLWFLSILY
ncbi:MAG: hypothetical protein KKA79_03790 [Nanoarchaeota archaeon]|nr:hypothetical protein [Nanoarchaeota archaeon]MCG2717874.1 hypothetical protein [Nanoarchaeota archaeon]